jgi:hypothetical protein
MWRMTFSVSGYSDAPSGAYEESTTPQRVLLGCAKINGAAAAWELIAVNESRNTMGYRRLSSRSVTVLRSSTTQRPTAGENSAEKPCPIPIDHWVRADHLTAETFSWV